MNRSKTPPGNKALEEWMIKNGGLPISRSSFGRAVTLKNKIGDDGVDTLKKIFEEVQLGGGAHISEAFSQRILSMSDQGLDVWRYPEFPHMWLW